MITVLLNGTRERIGNAPNEIIRDESEAAISLIRFLGWEVIPDTDFIIETLSGLNQDFIDKCCSMFEPGRVVEFQVSEDFVFNGNP